ncbi:MAG: type II toxin-antitoxin system prevent-host-death family antitoxin [Terracidiphilus sp.]|jgi:prevent-host-death family protein
MPHTVHQAKTHFSRLLKEAEAGKEVVVMRGKKPVAKIVPINEPAAEQPEPNFRLAGAYRGRMHWDEDAFDPMTDEELVECGLGYMLDAPFVLPPVGSPNK